MDRDELLRESEFWLDVIASPRISDEQKLRIVRSTTENFNSYANKGYLDYRKSMVELRDDPALEWEGQGSILVDLSGRRYIDCLGGYGIYSAGIRHPKIVKAVADQLARMPLSSQELIDPLRGALSELLGEIAPGDLQYSFFINNGTDAVEGAYKLARLFTGKINFISSIRGFHGKSCGSLSLMGKWEYREPFLPLLPGIHFVEFGDADAVEDELYKADATGKGVAGGDHGADPGRGRGDRAAGRLLAAHPQGLRRVRRAAHRRRSPDRAGPHRPACSASITGTPCPTSCAWARRWAAA